jgi:hypothetical protein
MSTSDFKQTAHAFKTWMAAVQAEIDRGDRQGATVIYRAAHLQVRLPRRWWLWKKRA